MSGCERGRRTRCERGTEIHPTNRATTTPTSTSSTNQHKQNHQHQHEDQHHHHHQHTPPWTMANRQHHHQHRHQQHQYNDHPSTTISTNTETSTTSTIVSTSSTTTSTSATCRNLLCTCQYVCARFIKIYSYVLQNKKMLARRFLYLHMFEMRPLVRYTAKRNKVLRTTLIWYMNYTKVYAKSHQNTADTMDTQTDTTSPRAMRLKATLVK